MTIQMSMDDIMLSETSQTQKEKYYEKTLISIISILRNQNSQTHRSRVWNSGYQGLEGGETGDIS